METPIIYNPTGLRITVQNIFVNPEKLSTYVPVWSNEHNSYIYVYPISFKYGTENLHTAQTFYYRDFNILVNSLNLSEDKIKELESVVNTRIIKSFHQGQKDGAKWERKCQEDKNLVPY